MAFGLRQHEAHCVQLLDVARLKMFERLLHQLSLMLVPSTIQKHDVQADSTASPMRCVHLTTVTAPLLAADAETPH